MPRKAPGFAALYPGYGTENTGAYVCISMQRIVQFIPCAASAASIPSILEAHPGAGGGRPHTGSPGPHGQRELDYLASGLT